MSENFADEYNESSHYLHEKQKIAAYKPAPLFAPLNDVICSRTWFEVYAGLAEDDAIPNSPDLLVASDSPPTHRV